jgi:hypothetical protein
MAPSTARLASRLQFQAIMTWSVMLKGNFSPMTSVGRPLSKTAASKRRCPWTELDKGCCTTINR